MTDEEKREIIAALKAESTDVTLLEVVSSLDGLTSLPVAQGNKLVRAPIPLLAKPATDAAEIANVATENANAAAARAETAADIAEQYARTADDEDVYVRGTLNDTDGTITESVQAGSVVCNKYIGVPSNTEKISVWLYMITPLTGNAAIVFYNEQHGFLSVHNIVANSVNDIDVPTGCKFLRYQMPDKNVVEMRISADGWRLVESLDPTVIKDSISAERNDRVAADSEIRSEIAELTKTVPNDIHTDYSNDGVSIDLRRDGVQIATDTIEPATEELAGVMSAADKIQQRLLGERIEEVNDALTTERGARESAIEDVNSKITAEQQARNSADGMLATALDSEQQTRKAAITNVKGMITDETAAREAADSEIRTEMSNLTDTVADGMFASYDDSSVTMDLKRGDVSLYGETIASATPTNAGVMSAEDKRKLEAAIYQVDDTDYFPDYVETQVQGWDGDGHSIVINAATEELAGVMSAEDKIEQRNIRTFLETFKKNLIPSGLTVSCLKRITLGNVEPIYITAELSPETSYRNIIYISDNKAVTVGTDGRVTPVSVGKSVVSVIPTCNTSLAKTIIVEVGKPLARLVNDRATLRLTSSGVFRLT